jgi:hypothetical protein
MSFIPVVFSSALLYTLFGVWMKGKQIQLDLHYYNKSIIYKVFNKVNWLPFQIGLQILRFQGSGGSK